MPIYYIYWFFYTEIWQSLSLLVSFKLDSGIIRLEKLTFRGPPCMLTFRPVTYVSLAVSGLSSVHSALNYSTRRRWIRISSRSRRVAAVASVRCVIPLLSLFRFPSVAICQARFACPDHPQSNLRRVGIDIKLYSHSLTQAPVNILGCILWAQPGLLFKERVTVTSGTVIESL